MATVTTPTPAIGPKTSVSEYLDREWAAEHSGGRKTEFVEGEVREMPGASEAHNFICWNIGALLRFAFKGRPFAAYPGDMRVRAGNDGPYYYPDLAIARSPAKIIRDRGATLLDPIVVFEVISPTTEGIDRGEKLSNYAKIPSLVDYVIVAQHAARIDHCSRQPDGSWRLLLLEGVGETLSLPSIGVELPLAEVYDRVLPEAGGTSGQ